MLSGELSSVRRRRRLRCWLGLPVRSLLDPVVRSSLRSMEAALWSEERGAWCVPAWGVVPGWSSLSEAFVSAVVASGLCRSSWWSSVRVDVAESAGGWSGVSVERPVVEGVSEEELSELSGEDLLELSGERSSVVGRLAARVLARRR